MYHLHVFLNANRILLKSKLMYFISKFNRSICGVRVRVEHSSGKVRPKPWMGPRGSRGPPRGRSRAFDPKDRCYECGGVGHYAYDCRRGGGSRKR